MQCSRIFLHEHTKRDPGNLPDPYLIEELNSIYYINLRAWIIWLGHSTINFACDRKLKTPPLAEIVTSSVEVSQAFFYSN